MQQQQYGRYGWILQQIKLFPNNNKLMYASFNSGEIWSMEKYGSILQHIKFLSNNKNNNALTYTASGEVWKIWIYILMLGWTLYYIYINMCRTTTKR